MDVADWLRTLGLERYQAAFRKNDVSAYCATRPSDHEAVQFGHPEKCLVFTLWKLAGCRFR
jgi:hypothetical protein